MQPRFKPVTEYKSIPARAIIVWWNGLDHDPMVFLDGNSAEENEKIERILVESLSNPIEGARR